MPPARRDLPMSSTGDSDSDAIAKAGLFGLSLVMAQRTAAEWARPWPGCETDELAFFPLLSGGCGEPGNRYRRWRPSASAISAPWRNHHVSTRRSDGHGGAAIRPEACAIVLRDMDVPPLIPAPPATC